MNLKIAIDFDGVICDIDGIPNRTLDLRKRNPVKDSLDAVKYFKSLGYDIWVYSSNPDLGEVKKWLINHKFPELEITNIKKPAHIYIDDRAVRFTNWQDIRRYIG